MSDGNEVPNLFVESIINLDYDLSQTRWLGYDTSDVFWIHRNVFPTFTLYDPRDMDIFTQEADELLPDGWRINNLSAQFSGLFSALENIEFIANQVLWGSLGAGILVLSLVVILFIRNRQQEIGVYLALI